VAEAYPQINTISDLNQVLRDERQRNHLVALDTEFANRPDGLVGLKEMYDLQVGRANIRQMDAGLVYTAMHNNQVFAGLVYTTDGRLSA
ncbi:glycine/betaine ABC transporter substrate-binding protein, partial [Klebsiella pneumoniae]|nr:glycine/betaine ABC transporter substrate-binding protein [Klebsiella pneumoniae]